MVNENEFYYEKKISVLALLPLRNLPPEMAGKVLIEHLNSLEAGKIDANVDPVIYTILKYIAVADLD